MDSTKTLHRDHHNSVAIKNAARGRWIEILTAMSDLTSDHLNGKNQPCPRCGGTNRFSAFKDVKDRGGVICRKCHADNNGDGFATLQWMNGWDFSVTLANVADHLNLKNRTNGKTTNGKKPPTLYPSIDAAISEGERQTGGECVAKWPYHDASGELVFYIARFNTAKGKEFRPLVPHADGKWSPSGLTSGRPLYRLPEIIDEPRVYIVEGEKCCEAALTIGLPATTSSNGAKSVRSTDWTPLAGKEVILVPDNDDAGEDYITRVAAELSTLEPKCELYVARLDGLGAKEDIVDWLERRDAVEPEALREAIEALTIPWESESWSEPRPLRIAMPSVMTFDTELLPWSLRRWIEDIAERMQCPIDFPAVAAMVVLSSIVGRRICIRPKQYDDWNVVPNLWGIVVGRPGVMKSPAVEEPIKVLKSLEAEARDAYQADLEDFKANEIVSKAAAKLAHADIQKHLKKQDFTAAKAQALTTIKEDQIEPTRRRFFVNDPTIAKLHEILAQNPNGVAMFRDELYGLLATLDKEENRGDRAFLLECWSGTTSYVSDRIERGTTEAESLVLSIVGGIQPARLRKYLADAVRNGNGDDGLIQRFQLVVWPDVAKAFRNVDRWPETEAKQTAHEALKRLANLDPDDIGAESDDDEFRGLSFLRFSDDAQQRFNAWRTDLEREIRSEIHPPHFESHLSKYRSLMPSLALLIHLAEGGIGPVTDDAAARAVAWIEYLRSHAERMYGASIEGESVQAARELIRRIAAGDLADGFTLRDITRKGWSGLTEREVIVDALEELTELEWIRPERQENSTGRPKTAFRINPLIFQGVPTDALTKPTKGTREGVSSVLSVRQ